MGCGCHGGAYGLWWWRLWLLQWRLWQVESGGRGGVGGGYCRFLCSSFYLFILMSSLYYLNEVAKNIEILMFNVF